MTGQLHDRPQLGAAEALERVSYMLVAEPFNARLLVQRAQWLLALGRLSEARGAASAALHTRPNDSAVLDAIGGIFSRASDQTRALTAYDQAIALAPGEPHFRFNRAAVRRFLGDLDGAEADYDRVIEVKRHDYEAHLNRSELRPQTRERNHIAELEALLREVRANWSGEVALRYALAKEYEDLGEYERSFAHLKRGAQLRRLHLRYDVTRDVATVEWIIQAYPGTAYLRPCPPASEATPIFIVGLPRSGSTLLERILASHSQVRAGGELPDFALALTAAVKGLSGQAQLTRHQLVAQSARVDFPSLGRDYLARVRAQGIDADYFTDKMPLNYLYCGLIHRALPNARIVHVRRAPMAACYAIYKTLFQDGYPFSYDLSELGHYYLAYRRLMRHWGEMLPGTIHELRYEDLVREQQGETRRLLEFCGLEWEDACVDFHTNTTPTTTASAAQVRRALYDTSVSQWCHYRSQLASLEEQLRAANIEID
jgi:tetratricopeptide (TPR) repeat protein